MPVVALGYLGVRSDRLEDWSGFASRLLGMQIADQGGKQCSFRMDDRKQRLVVSDEPGETLAFLGFEVSAPADLDALAARLEAAAFVVNRGSRSLADRRFVNDLIVVHDPAGNRVELFHGAHVADTPFVPGRQISGFKTGALGMGHAVLQVPSVDLLLPFYRDVLGFGVSDYGFTPYPLYFFHLNSRHHSFAMVGTGRTGFHHFMVEFGSLDDVGQGYDLAGLEPDRIAYTLGRHTNDYMTSFYAHTPSGFFVENGWGGREIDPATWEPHETFDGPSFWGHERLYMEPEPRARLREMRLEAARRGVQAPPLVDCPWLWRALDKSGV
ncbi:VOC family protein [Chelatococcus asaccharovorans]|uniref:VOC family protein n=1 Tax=Chelatococcus asaccharovorans TaxID=28210 RepID=UPI00224C6865|nr:VOC family protein [Chelatococcus asaccharovorans]CAH1659439.1 Biphenyl-2,3-diol 1,2-dioxygenase [Chelatococcus asaccharovorans]CAH1687942.1 Biphenyl-2,3-diol 1,2-dioxygenase [Chelatococcus asaccharovorans]